MRNDTNIKKEIGAKLKQMEPALTTQDKQDAAEVLKVHPNTIHNYLQGAIGNVDKGLDLVEFFINRINEKVNRLKSITKAA